MFPCKATYLVPIPVGLVNGFSFHCPSLLLDEHITLRATYIHKNKKVYKRRKETKIRKDRMIQPVTQIQYEEKQAKEKKKAPEMNSDELTNDVGLI